MPSLEELATLRARREAIGLTIPQLAHMAGVKERAIVNAEELELGSTAGPGESPSLDRVFRELDELEDDGWFAHAGVPPETRYYTINERRRAVVNPADAP
jgi:transcriptional regulator with XRE-family HTH domain